MQSSNSVGTARGKAGHRVETKVSIDATKIRRHSAADALVYADEVLGDSTNWFPSLVAYRLASEFQADWKTEVGCWLLLARDQGFLRPLVKRLGRALGDAPNPSVIGPNDSAHRLLLQELAPAMTAYYLTGMGWTFEAWEPAVSGGDADVRLASPCGVRTDVQVKAPDQPGDRENGQIVDGEFDERVLVSTDRAMAQLHTSPCPGRLVVVSPQRIGSFRGGVLASHVVGRQVLRRGVRGVTQESRGRFASEIGGGISAVASLNLVRGEEETLYRCTVIRNPWLRAPIGELSTASFPHSRVLSMEQGIFSWHPEPPRDGLFPTGTPYLDSAVALRSSITDTDQ